MSYSNYIKSLHERDRINGHARIHDPSSKLTLYCPIPRLFQRATVPDYISGDIIFRFETKTTNLKTSIQQLLRNGNFHINQKLGWERSRAELDLLSINTEVDVLLRYSDTLEVVDEFRSYAGQLISKQHEYVVCLEHYVDYTIQITHHE